MNLGNVKIRPKSYVKANFQRAEIQKQRSICQYVLQLKKVSCPRERGCILRQLISQCYSNWRNQFYLCNNLGVPFRDGPIALTKIPSSFRSRGNQIMTLFKYLQKIKQSYISWVIYLDSDLGVLNLKLITIFQLPEISPQFEDDQAVVGVFIGKRYYSKLRTLSTKSTHNSQQQAGLSSKPTQESLNQHSKSKSNKSTKSLSMKQKQPGRTELSLKTLDHTFSSQPKGYFVNNKSCSTLKSPSGLPKKNKKISQF